MPGCVELTQRQLVMILVVQHVHQVGVERMHVVQLGKVLNDLRQAIVEVLLRVLHLARVECPDSGYFVALVDHRRGLALCLRQHNVDEVLWKGQKIKYYLHIAHIGKHLQ